MSCDDSSFPSAEELEFKRLNLPNKPGCYLYKGQDHQILYVGKAKSLRNRVNSYWKDNRHEDPIYTQKIRRLVSMIRDIEVFVVENEKEALLLENELIKKYQPYFNVMLKDDKSFPWVQITNEDFPRIKIIRGPERFGLQHKYIGPFVDGGDLKRMLRFIRKIFPYCTCKSCSAQKNRSRPCVYHQINLCPAPCLGKISKEDYNENIKNVEDMLYGEISGIKTLLETKMTEASQSLDFEAAAKWRDRLKALEIFTVDQSVLSYSTNDTENNLEDVEKLPNFDVIEGQYSDTRAGIVIIHIRSGRLLNKTPYIVELKEKILSQEEYFIVLLQQHYFREGIPLPDEIVINHQLEPELQTTLENYLSKKNKKNVVKFRAPLESDKTAGLLRIAKKNIELLIKQKDEYEQHLTEQNLTQQILGNSLKQLQELIGMEELPLIIEGYDMSHTQGTDYVGSKVCFVEGKPQKSDYRHYKVRETQVPDDVNSMREILTRRVKHLVKGEETEPDLIVVDGGRGQLNMAHDILTAHGLDHITHIGIAKPEGRSEISKSPKLIFPDTEEEMILPLDSPALHLIQHLRDEAHRFAITFHRKLRNKRQTQSILDEIPNIGPARKRKLLQYFGSVAAIEKASVKQIASIVGQKLGQEIVAFLQAQNEEIKKKLAKKQTRRKKTLRKSS